MHCYRALSDLEAPKLELPNSVPNTTTKQGLELDSVKLKKKKLPVNFWRPVRVSGPAAVYPDTGIAPILSLLCLPALKPLQKSSPFVPKPFSPIPRKWWRIAI